ncbi:efflux RND transporter periplasmic adaptor subunit [Alkalihalobacillus sp. MEB130]|uniref:efflux RND transporter periplasmic adaptor subunit n=1 Tax=Alkalihalobacillus sp. MEB130 TaxID=2976704 RepID=UPI0028DDEF2F|nr:efflux RND transporter periplasmic adaptor subunit [Alkalihalobacillus sp. MEB130]MDT8862733.1 efflux RND transporter periplasmic adaptor subunit [Alkalihalobacillus sp. MEB130]
MQKYSIALLFLFLLSACATDDITSDQMERQRLLVDVENITRDSIRQNVELSGQLLPKNQVPLFTMMPLEVTGLHIEIGQEVQQGDLLLTLDDTEATKQLQQARRAVEELKQGLIQVNELNQSIERNAANIKDREQELQQSIVRTQALMNELDPANLEDSILQLLQSSLDISIRQAELLQVTGAASSFAPVNTMELELQISQAEEAVRQAEQAVQATKLTSPISGIIAQVDVAEGQTALPNVPLVTIVDLTQMMATFPVNSFQVTQLQAGMQAELQVTGIHETITGEISSISPVVHPQTNTFTVQIPVSNDNVRLKGGMRTTAIIDLDTIEEALIIPSDAVLYQDGEAYTFVVTDQIVRRQALELGTRDGEQFEVISGVEEDDQVVTTGKERVTDGAEITIRSE